MSFDLAHAVVSALLIMITVYVMRRTGLADGSKTRFFDVKIFAGVLAVMFLLNVIWPY